jgi:hypothetical protein
MTDTLPDASGQIASAGANIAKGASQLSGLASAGIGIGATLLGMLIGNLFAEGGLVRGPGTGTSDSIPAMVSNGEYIVKASATKKYLPLLSAINNNRLPAFAEGGLVSTELVKTPPLNKLEPVESAKGSTTTIINWQVTGDISRQTRAEMVQMLPIITAGVNAHNREKGYRG